MVNWDKIKTSLKMHKNGIIIGMVSGLILTIYLAATGADLSLAAGRAGLAQDIIQGAVAVKNVALTKVGIALIVLGGIIGYYVDILRGK